MYGTAQRTEFQAGSQRPLKQDVPAVPLSVRGRHRGGPGSLTGLLSQKVPRAQRRPRGESQCGPIEEITPGDLASQNLPPVLQRQIGTKRPILHSSACRTMQSPG
jgi:hypothetical protein